MAERPIKRALIAVYDKTGIAEFARALVDEFGVEIISTGGTAKHLKEAGIPVTMVEQVTGFPEMLDGRVKTLHPKIHAAILADRDKPEHMRQLAEHGIEPIDMVVANLYPFEKTVADPNCRFEDAIEMIDIGGPCMLRAAAKNHRHVLAVSESWLYQWTLGVMRLAGGMGKWPLSLAFDVFEKTAKYDAAIMQWMATSPEGHKGRIAMHFSSDQRFELRYGENPHQKAQVCHPSARTSEQDPIGNAYDCDVRMSYNNFADASSALELCRDLNRSLKEKSAVCFIKHTNPCGVGVASRQIEALQKAYLGDPNAAMGGILATNSSVDAEFATAVMNAFAKWGKDAGAGGFFVEVWLAPRFDEASIEVVKTSKEWGSRVRMIEVGKRINDLARGDESEYRRIIGGMLLQDSDMLSLNEDQWKVVTNRPPTDAETDDLRLAWLIAKHTKSNAISICKDGMLIGNGAGQMSRVMSCRIATWLARENGHAEKLAGSVAASDAFFPFRDGPDILMDAGVTAIIQPGGSKRDEETIAACDERDVAMIFTGTRHFKH
jgi:phosphoribosylaminoimidazolecarboxamide formyltransferase/IMP cyclohydrolase